MSQLQYTRKRKKRKRIHGGSCASIIHESVVLAAEALQIRQAVAGNIYKRKWHFNIIGLSRGMEKCSVDFIQEVTT